MPTSPVAISLASQAFVNDAPVASALASSTMTDTAPVDVSQASVAMTNPPPVEVSQASSVQTNTAPVEVSQSSSAMTNTAPVESSQPSATMTNTAPVSVSQSASSMTNTAPGAKRAVGKIPSLNAITVATTSLKGPDGVGSLFGLTVNGVSLGEDQIVLCVAEEEPQANGLWQVQESEDIRPPDFDSIEDTRDGLIVVITGGTKITRRYLLASVPANVGDPNVPLDGDNIYFTDISNDPKSLASQAFTNTAPVARAV